MVMQIGVGCIFFGLGLFIAWATVVVCIKLFPWIIRKIVALGSRLLIKSVMDKEDKMRKTITKLYLLSVLCRLHSELLCVQAVL